MRRMILTIIIVVCIAGCCTGHPMVEKALKDAVAVNKGHMNDKALPEEAKLIAQDNYDFDWQILHVLTGEELPKEVKARMDARKGADGK